MSISKNTKRVSYISVQLIISVVFLFFQTVAHAQFDEADKAIKEANQVLAIEDFNQAIQLLKSHEGYSVAAQLLAQSYYWNGEIKEAKETYQKAISNHPAHPEIQLDYGRMLYELGEAKAAEKALAEFVITDPQNVEANLYLGHLAFQKGVYKQSKIYLQKILLQYPDHAESLNILQQIKNQKAWHLEAGTFFQSDNQPLQVLNPFVKTGKFQNPWLHPDIRFNSYFFDTDTLMQQAYKLELGNTFTIPNAQLKMRISTGVFLDPIDGGSHWLGSFLVDKKLAQKFSITGQWEHQPLFNAASSLEQVVTADHYSLAITKENGDNWMGRMAYQYSAYFDGNSIQTAYIWVLTPALKWKVSKWRIGYSGAFADAKEIRFKSVLSLDDIIENFVDSMEISGIYSPYFTPKNQLIHSIIGWFEIELTKSLALKLNATVSLLASADIPFLYLDDTATGVDFVQGFFKEKTRNIELKAALNFAISKNMTLNVFYQYTDNFFYRSNVFQIKLNWLL